MVSLDSLKYAELQRLAKSVGLKANVKCEKLLKALKEHYAQEQTAANANESGDVDARDGSSRSVFVTERRQKCRLAKRRLSDPVQNEEPEEKKERQDKRRKVSSAVTAESLVKAVESKENSSIANDASTEPSEKAVGRRTAGKIPRHEGLMKNKSSLRPTTPNFKKLHEAQFKKMESIDSYVQRKNKQMEVKKPPVSRSSLFSPEAEKKQIPKRKSALKENSIFRPTVLTTNKINVRFSQATHDNEYKCSSVKTPARMSPFVPLTSTPGRKSGVHSKLQLNSVGAINKTPGVTPFVFGENTSMSATPGTSKKNVFDLKASLSRPLTYKPHKGKLKPFGAGTEDTTLNKSQTVPSHQKNFKKHQIQTREQRRTERAEDRNQRKEKLMAARRGLIMA